MFVLLSQTNPVAKSLQPPLEFEKLESVCLHRCMLVPDEEELEEELEDDELLELEEELAGAVIVKTLLQTQLLVHNLI